MSGRDNSTSSDSENACVVCFKNVDIYSIGVCDHAVCFECSTRMRVLCRQNECPICRQDLPKVIFTKELQPFSILKAKVENCNLQDRKFGILFYTPSIQRAYYRLLEHNCSMCSESERRWPFKTFQQLKDHMRKEHELFYCDLCVDNLRIFSFERKCYTRQELAQHRRKGDADNTSHRGHPLCEFCDTRYMDSDELFRHLRRDHLFCHFCDADGKHLYYSSYDDLRNHFLEEHYLCEEGDCKNEKFTSVFRTDIDFKAHIASVHSKNLSKAATRQARTLELEFTLAPRARPDQLKNNRRPYSSRNNDRQDDLEGAVGYENYYMEPGGAHSAQERTFVDSLSSDNFPSLGAAVGNAPGHSRPSSSVTFTNVGGTNNKQSGSTVNRKTGQFKSEDFPTLGERNGYRAPEVTITRSVKGQQGLVRNSQNFPVLGGASGPSNSGTSTLRFSVNSNTQDHQQVPNVSIQVKHKPNGAITTSIRASAASSSQSFNPKSSEAFPALSRTAAVPEARWVQSKPKKSEPKSSKVAPAPLLTLPASSDFPTLSKGGKNEKKTKKTSSVTVPVNSTNNRIDSGSNSSSGDNINEKHAKHNQDRNKDSKNNMKNSKNLSDAKLATKSVSSKATESGADASESKSKNKKKKSKNANNEKTSSALSSNAENSKTEKKSDSSDATGDNSESLQNGIVKKRSELKIDTLEPSNSQPIVKPEDFPALGVKNPPPGFNIKPPPGFSNTNAIGMLNSNSVSNDLTFTNSTGRSYSIRPITKYHQPENFSRRNRDLIEKFMSILNDNEVIREFKNYSDLFRSGTLSADKYYEHCKCILGAEFQEVFPELLVLLPDIEKQQELYKVHAGKSECKNLLVCDDCKQVVLKNELSSHNVYHNLNEAFPALGKSSSESCNPWKK